jgi:hypothetical protein
LPSDIGFSNCWKPQPKPLERSMCPLAVTPATYMPAARTTWPMVGQPRSNFQRWPSSEMTLCTPGRSEVNMLACETVDSLPPG